MDPRSDSCGTPSLVSSHCLVGKWTGKDCSSGCICIQDDDRERRRSCQLGKVNVPLPVRYMDSDTCHKCRRHLMDNRRREYRMQCLGHRSIRPFR